MDEQQGEVKKQDWGGTLLIVLGVAALMGALWMLLDSSGFSNKATNRQPPINQPSTSGTPVETFNPIVKMVTDAGEIEIELYEDQAPNTVKNFVSLCDKKFYDGLKIHRRDNMCVQGGDPAGNGTGGPGYRIKREAVGNHTEGCIAMAETAPDSAGSQFYFILDANAAKHLNGQYCVFGQVIKGWDAAKPGFKIGTVIQSATVTKRRSHDYKPDTLPPTR